MLSNNVDQLLLDSKNTLIETKQSEEVGWYINELDSLGIESSSNSNNNKNNGSNDIQQLEDQVDEIKQAFIHNYKICYNEL